MAGNQLPVLTLDFSDEKIQKLQEIADKFKTALSIGPGGLPVPSTPSAPLPAPATPPGSTTKNGKKQTGETEFDKFLKELNKDAQGTVKTFGLINKTLGATTSTLKGLFETTVSWGAKIASLAVVGPFGYGYMASNVAEQYRGPQGLGITQGQMDAAKSVYGTRVSGTDSILQSLASARENPGDPMAAGLSTLGLNRLDSPAENLPKFLTAVSGILEKYKGSGVSQAILESQKIGGVTDVATANQILANSDQIPGLNDTFNQRSRQLDQTLTPAMLRQYQDTSSNLTHNADRTGNAFLAALARLGGPINLLSDNLTSSIERFVNGPNGQAVFDTLADGLQMLAGWLGSKEFQSDLGSFSRAVKSLAEGTWSIIRFFGGSDEEQKKIIEETERKNSYALKDGEKRPPPAFLGGAEALGRTIFGVTTEAAKGLARDAPGVADMLFIKPVSGMMERAGDALAPNLPRGLRNNNPGNLNFARQPGATLENGPDARFAAFQTMGEGIAALDRQLGLYIGRGNNTIRGIVSEYAPEKDDNNEAAYRAELHQLTGISVDEKIDWGDSKKIKDLIRAIIVHENGYRGSSISEDEIAAAMGRNKNWSAPGSSPRDSRVQIDINQKPGSNIDAQVNGLSLVRR